MSTTPQERIEYWKNKEGHTGSSILASELSYSQATALEKSEAEERGCYYHPGGEDNGRRNWSVYHLWGGTVPAL